MPYFGVAMIVKDEVETIAATLASVRGAVDFVTVVDTGSTDGTQQAAAAALAGTPHQLLEHPFEDFSTTRNWALRVRAPQVISRVLVGNEYGQG